MISNKKQQIINLLKSIETGDPAAVSVVNEAKYIQHNPETHEGSEGLAVLFKRLSKTSPKVNIVRIFEDGDYIFAHTEYDFATRNIGFEIFRFEDGQAVEHWDNIQGRIDLNNSDQTLSNQTLSIQTMVDGSTEITDLEKTESNRLLIQSFVQNILIEKQLDDLDDYITKENYTEHNPRCVNEQIELRDILSGNTTDDLSIHYKKCHHLLAEGNFVLSACEGTVNQTQTSFFDLYRLEDGKIVEHWDTTEAIPARSEWKNENGKF